MLIPKSRFDFRESRVHDETRSHTHTCTRTVIHSAALERKGCTESQDGTSSNRRVMEKLNFLAERVALACAFPGKNSFPYDRCLVWRTVPLFHASGRFGMRTWEFASVHNGPRAYLIHFRFPHGDEWLRVVSKGERTARSFRFFPRGSR